MVFDSQRQVRGLKFRVRAAPFFFSFFFPSFLVRDPRGSRAGQGFARPGTPRLERS